MHPVADLLICLRFFSRLPVPASRREHTLGAHGLATAAAMAPVAGALIGLVAGLVLAAALAIGLPPLLAAAFAVASLVLITGALHEDGLADCADGFGGGRSVARKLEIMRDSTIGTYGACAVVMSLLLRVAAVAAIMAHGPTRGVATLIAAAAVSRTACLIPLILLPSARPTGLGASAGRPTPQRMLVAAALAIGFSLVLVPAGYGVERIALTLAMAGAGALAVAGIARRQIGGHTGDVAGAVQQIAEIAALTVLAAA